MKIFVSLFFFFILLFCSPVSQTKIFDIFKDNQKNLIHFKFNYSYEYIELSHEYGNGKFDRRGNLDEFINNSDITNNGSVNELLQINTIYNASVYYYWNWVSVGLDTTFYSKNLLPYNTENVVLIPLKDEVSFNHISPQIFLSFWIFNVGLTHHLLLGEKENLSTEQTWHFPKGNSTTFYSGIYFPIVKNIFDIDISYELSDFQNPIYTFAFILHFTYYSKMKVAYQRIERKDLDNLIVDTAFYEFNFFLKKYFYLSTQVYKLLYQKKGSPSFGFSLSINYLIDLGVK